MEKILLCAIVPFFLSCVDKKDPFDGYCEAFRVSRTEFCKKRNHRLDDFSQWTQDEYLKTWIGTDEEFNAMEAAGYKFSEGEKEDQRRLHEMFDSTIVWP